MRQTLDVYGDCIRRIDVATENILQRVDSLTALLWELIDSDTPPATHAQKSASKTES